MATRFYLPSTTPSNFVGTIGLAPAYGAWTVTTQAVRLACYRRKQNTAMANASISGDTDKTLESLLIRQYISGSLKAQTIAQQTVKWQIKGLETNAANNLYAAISIRSWNYKTLAFQTLLAITADDVELPITTATNRQFSATTAGAITVAVNDRLVIEIGVSGDPASSGSNFHNSTLVIGDNSATDLPEDDLDQNTYNPWVEFANTITFAEKHRMFTMFPTFKQ